VIEKIDERRLAGASDLRLAKTKKHSGQRQTVGERSMGLTRIDLVNPRQVRQVGGSRMELARKQKRVVFSESAPGRVSLMRRRIGKSK